MLFKKKLSVHTQTNTRDQNVPRTGGRASMEPSIIVPSQPQTLRSHRRYGVPSHLQTVREGERAHANKNMFDPGGKHMECDEAIAGYAACG